MKFLLPPPNTTNNIKTPKRSITLHLIPLTLVMTTILLISPSKEKCMHNELFGGLPIVPLHYSSPYSLHHSIHHRFLQAETLRNMRIFIDKSVSDSFAASKPEVRTKYEMSLRILTNVKLYLETYFKVVSPLTMTTNSITTCNDQNIPAFSKEIDLYIIIKPEDNPSSGYFAAASQCRVSATTGRPVIGIYFLNFAGMETTNIKEFLYFSTFAHELFHILGFASDLFPTYRNPDGSPRNPAQVSGTTDINGVTFSTLKLPELITYAQKYFACDNLSDGIPLENDGGSGTAGSHWEKTYLPNEFMNPTIENPGILSGFTMTVMEATGWYTVSYFYS